MSPIRKYRSVLLTDDCDIQLLSVVEPIFITRWWYPEFSSLNFYPGGYWNLRVANREIDMIHIDVWALAILNVKRTFSTMEVYCELHIHNVSGYEPILRYQVTRPTCLHLIDSNSTMEFSKHLCIRILWPRLSYVTKTSQELCRPWRACDSPPLPLTQQHALWQIPHAYTLTVVRKWSLFTQDILSSCLPSLHLFPLLYRTADWISVRISYLEWRTI